MVKEITLPLAVEKAYTFSAIVPEGGLRFSAKQGMIYNSEFIGHVLTCKSKGTFVSFIAIDLDEPEGQCIWLIKNLGGSWDSTHTHH